MGNRTPHNAKHLLERYMLIKTGKIQFLTMQAIREGLLKTIFVEGCICTVMQDSVHPKPINVFYILWWRIAKEVLTIDPNKNADTVIEVRLRHSFVSREKIVSALKRKQTARNTKQLDSL